MIYNRTVFILDLEDSITVNNANNSVDNSNALDDD